MDFSSNMTAFQQAAGQNGMASFGDLSTMYQDNAYFVWAALGATVAAVPLSTLMFGSSKAPAPFLSSEEWKTITLTKVEQETHDVKRLTFKLPHKKQLLGLPAGQCLKVKAATFGKAGIEQAFNPVSIETPGEVVLLVKAYPGRHGMGPTHPEHLIGTSLHKLQVGQTIEIKGPFGEFAYQPGQYKSVGLLAGGTGVTAVASLASAILNNPEDTAKVSLLYASNSMKDVLLKTSLDAMAAGSDGKLKVTHVLNEAPDSMSADISVGLLEKETISQAVGSPSKETLLVVCGPPAFVAHQTANLAALGHDNVVVIDNMPRTVEGCAYLNTDADRRFNLPESQGRQQNFAGELL